MATLQNPVTETWYLAHDGQSVFHHGTVGPNQSLETAQPHLETFSTLSALNARLVALGQPSVPE